MIAGGKMKCALKGMGYYKSPLGGAANPYRIPDGVLLFELITAGAVYSPSGDTLCGAGWIFVHQPGQATIWRSKPDEFYECMVASFHLEQVCNPEPWPREFFWEDVAGAVHFAHEMLYAFHHTHVDHALLSDVALSQFRYRLDSFRRQKSRMENPPRIAAIMAYIEKNYSKALGIEDMAAHVGMSSSHLYAHFREHVKITPHQYLIRQRMHAAKHALATSSVPIKAIAADVGYVNPENFCRAFKQHTGFTAAAYRKKYMIY
ncbi:MAG: AraC family transcriptional regulator [Kiritimatiellales bacterium]|nr:AraC family transcriptional regulator [Kiritimatiellales bacterium]